MSAKYSRRLSPLLQHAGTSPNIHDGCWNLSSIYPLCFMCTWSEFHKWSTVSCEKVRWLKTVCAATAEIAYTCSVGLYPSDCWPHAFNNPAVEVRCNKRCFQLTKAHTTTTNSYHHSERRALSHSYLFWFLCEWCDLLLEITKETNLNLFVYFSYLSIIDHFLYFLIYTLDKAWQLLKFSQP